MATPRSQLVDDQLPLYYHLVSRCVQRAWLCGRDPVSGKDYSYRKGRIIKRLRHLAQFFAVEVAAYAIMANHFHLVVYYDPKACEAWSDEEVARRWVGAFPPRKGDGEVDEALQAEHESQLLGDEAALVAARRKLGNLSCFMQHLKQPLAWQANQEAGCNGDYWANRFYSGALLTEAAVLATMAYVDLNPIRSKIAKTIEACENTSVQERLKRLEGTRERLSQIMEPIVSGLNASSEGPQQAKVRITLGDYLTHLRAIAASQNDKGPVTSWITGVAAIGKRQRAYGSKQALSQWLEHRGMRCLEQALPD